MLYRDTVHKIGNTIKDSRGHVLYPIGNINIVDGQEIWTDGKVIFGNQTGGYNATFNPQSGVMPICLMSGRESYSPHVARVEDYNNMPLEIDKNILWDLSLTVLIHMAHGGITTLMVC